jgi:hypothetical protein
LIGLIELIKLNTESDLLPPDASGGPGARIVRRWSFIARLYCSPPPEGLGEAQKVEYKSEVEISGTLSRFSASWRIHD